jgi:hypothetical protein
MSAAQPILCRTIRVLLAKGDKPETTRGAVHMSERGKQKMRTKMTDEERKAWLAIRKEAGLKIDPETAEVEWIYGQTLDPYGVYPELPEEYWQVGREYFARSSGSDVWVNFDDLLAISCG